jgi:hypothetical protein
MISLQIQKVAGTGENPSLASLHRKIAAACRKRRLPILPTGPYCDGCKPTTRALPEGSRSVRHVLSLLFNGKSGLHINGKCGMKMPKSTHSTESDTVVGGTVFMVFALNCGPCSLFRPTSPLQPAIPQRLPRAATR